MQIDGGISRRPDVYAARESLIGAVKSTTDPGRTSRSSIRTCVTRSPLAVRFHRRGPTARNPPSVISSLTRGLPSRRRPSYADRRVVPAIGDRLRARPPVHAGVAAAAPRPPPTSATPTRICWAAKFHGESTDIPCPICRRTLLTTLNYTFGDVLGQYSGRLKATSSWNRWRGARGVHRLRRRGLLRLLVEPPAALVRPGGRVPRDRRGEPRERRRSRAADE